jgi:hypothetical protein
MRLPRIPLLRYDRPVTLRDRSDVRSARIGSRAAGALGLAAVVWAVPASGQPASAPPASAQSPSVQVAPVANVSEVPPAAAVPSGPRDPALMKTGIVLTAVGVAALVTAEALIIVYLTKWLDYSGETFGCGGVEDCPDELTLKPHPDLAYAALATGLVGAGLAGAGIPMIVSGARRASASPDPASVAWWIPRRVAIDRQCVQLTFEGRW